MSPLQDVMMRYLSTGRKWGGILVYAVLGIVTLAAPQMNAQPTTTPIRIDASEPFVEPVPARYHGGSSSSPSAGALGISSRYLTLNGRPWLPVMGEFHFSRYPEAKWEEEILKMKAAGVEIIATYVIWIHHEEIEGSSIGPHKKTCEHLRNCAPSMECMLLPGSVHGITAK